MLNDNQAQQKKTQEENQFLYFKSNEPTIIGFSTIYRESLYGNDSRIKKTDDRTELQTLNSIFQFISCIRWMFNRLYLQIEIKFKINWRTDGRKDK